MIIDKHLEFLISQLDESDKPAILSHLLRLNKTDRYLRFFATVSDSVLENYVKQLDFSESKGFGIFDEDKKTLIAFVHVSGIEEQHISKRAELGISIDETHRGFGLARRLMDRSVNYCKANDINILFISCLRENTKMQHMAKNAGLKVILDHNEAEAVLKLDEMPLPKATAISQEIAYDQIAIFDKCYRCNTELVLALFKNS